VAPSGIFESCPQRLHPTPRWHTDFDQFARKQVLVVGGGQSALESALSCTNAARRSEIAARTEKIRWLGGLVSRTIHRGFGPKIAKLLYAPTDVGPQGSVNCRETRFSSPFPACSADWLRKRSIRPPAHAGSLSRLQHVPMQSRRVVASAIPKGDRVKVRLDDGTERIFDHIFLGTDIAWIVSNTISFQRNLPNPFIASTDTRI